MSLSCLTTRYILEITEIAIVGTWTFQLKFQIIEASTSCTGEEKQPCSKTTCEPPFSLQIGLW